MTDTHGSPPMAFDTATLMARMGIVVSEVSADTVVGTMPVQGNTQPFGFLHGGASAVLAETLGSLGGFEHAPAGYTAVGTELSITHHRPVSEGSVTGTARALHLGSRICTYAIEITDDLGRMVATARLSCMLVEMRPAT